MEVEPVLTVAAAGFVSNDPRGMRYKLRIRLENFQVRVSKVTAQRAGPARALLLPGLDTQDALNPLLTVCVSVRCFTILKVKLSCNVSPRRRGGVEHVHVRRRLSFPVRLTSHVVPVVLLEYPPPRHFPAASRACVSERQLSVGFPE